MSKPVDKTRTVLPGENIRYVFTGDKAINRALLPIVFAFDVIRIPLPGANQGRIVAVTETEMIVPERHRSGH